MRPRATLDRGHPRVGLELAGARMAARKTPATGPNEAESANCNTQVVVIARSVDGSKKLPYRWCAASLPDVRRNIPASRPPPGREADLSAAAARTLDSDVFCAFKGKRTNAETRGSVADDVAPFYERGRDLRAS